MVDRREQVDVASDMGQTLSQWCTTRDGNEVVVKSRHHQRGQNDSEDASRHAGSATQNESGDGSGNGNGNGSCNSDTNKEKTSNNNENEMIDMMFDTECGPNWEQYNAIKHRILRSKPADLRAHHKSEIFNQLDELRIEAASNGLYSLEDRIDEVCTPVLEHRVGKFSCCASMYFKRTPRYRMLHLQGGVIAIAVDVLLYSLSISLLLLLVLLQLRDILMDKQISDLGVDLPAPVHSATSSARAPAAQPKQDTTKTKTKYTSTTKSNESTAQKPASTRSSAFAALFAPSSKNPTPAPASTSTSASTVTHATNANAGVVGTARSTQDLGWIAAYAGLSQQAPAQGQARFASRQANNNYYNNSSTSTSTSNSLANLMLTYSNTRQGP